MQIVIWHQDAFLLKLPEIIDWIVWNLFAVWKYVTIIFVPM